MGPALLDDVLEPTAMYISSPISGELHFGCELLFVFVICVAESRREIFVHSV